MKNLFLSTVVSLSLVSPVMAQDSFNVQQAMEEVRKENLQRIGVERKQQIVSTLRKRAEDLAAIDEAGFTVTPDGRLEPKQGVSASTSGAGQSSGSGGLQSGTSANASGETSGLFSDMGGTGESSLGGMPAWMNDQLNLAPDDASSGGGSFIALKAILSNRAVLSVNGSEKRYKEGDELPGGFTLAAINGRSVDVKSDEGDIETYYMDWASVSNRMSGASGLEDSTNVPRTFMQSGQPVQGLGAGF